MPAVGTAPDGPGVDAPLLDLSLPVAFWYFFHGMSPGGSNRALKVEELSCRAGVDDQTAGKHGPERVDYAMFTKCRIVEKLYSTTGPNRILSAILIQSPVPAFVRNSFITKPFIRRRVLLCVASYPAIASESQ